LRQLRVLALALSGQRIYCILTLFHSQLSSCLALLLGKYIILSAQSLVLNQTLTTYLLLTI